MLNGQTTVKESQQLPPTIITQEIDALITLTSFIAPEKPTLFLKAKMYSFTSLQRQHNDKKSYIILTHVFSAHR